jgi:5-keto 4-deoxyuronate isomerase
MSINFESRYARGPHDDHTLETQGVRENFRLDTVIEADQINCGDTHDDR